MAEVLEIQIKDTGTPAPASTPRPPAVPSAVESPKATTATVTGPSPFQSGRPYRDERGVANKAFLEAKFAQEARQIEERNKRAAALPPEPPRVHNTGPAGPAATFAPAQSAAPKSPTPTPPAQPLTVLPAPTASHAATIDDLLGKFGLPRLATPLQQLFGGRQAAAPPAPPTAASATSPATTGASAAGAAGAGEEAAAAGGALEGLAAAAGPVGAALVVAKVGVDKLTGGFDRLGHNIKFFGDELATVAGNNYLTAFKHGLQEIHHPLADIPIVGKLYESQLQAAIAPVKAFTTAVEGFTARAHELAGFSPSIAVAEQMGDIRGFFDDLKEAQRLGPDLARMLKAETGMQHDLREIFLPIKAVIVEGIADMLEVLRGLTELVRALIQSIAEYVKENKGKADFAVGFLQGLYLGPIPSALGYLREIAAKNGKPDEDVEIWLRSLYETRAEADNNAPAPNDARPNIPIVAPGIL